MSETLVKNLDGDILLESNQDLNNESDDTIILEKIYSQLDLDNDYIYHPNLTRISDIQRDSIVVESIVSLFLQGVIMELEEATNEFPRLTDGDYQFAMNLFKLEMNGENEELEASILEYIQKYDVEKGIMKERYGEKNLVPESIIPLPAADILDLVNFGYENVNIISRVTFPETYYTNNNLDLLSVFSGLHTSERLPVIGMVIGKQDPVVKVFKEFKKNPVAKSIIFTENESVNVKKYGLLLVPVINMNKATIDEIIYPPVYLKANNRMYIGLAFKKPMYKSLDDILNTVIQDVTDAIIRISPKYDDVQVQSFSIVIKTRINLSLAILNYLLNTEEVSKIFSQKPNVSNTFINMTHVNTNTVVYVRDNPYEVESSHIIVQNVNNSDFAVSIAKQVLSVYFLKDSVQLPKSIENTDRTKLKVKSVIKELRSLGIKVDSKECQRKQQPVLGSVEIQPNSYNLTYKEKQYVCPTSEYAYPGFTKNGIVCCFKKDQRTKQVFNYYNETIMVQASNLKVKPDPRFSTYVIKNPEDNTFHYFDQNGAFQQIQDEELLKYILDFESDLEKENETIWLPKVPLSSLRNTGMIKCESLPDFSKRADQVCDHHINKKIFGYTISGYPCCFTKSRPIGSKTEKPVKIGHIITTEKLLGDSRLGTLPSFLEAYNDMYYRYGIEQKDSGLLSAIRVAKKKYFTNNQEMRLSMISILKEDSDMFESIDDGTLALEFTQDEFIKRLLDPSITLEPRYVVELLSSIIETNIFIVSVSEESLVCKSTVSNRYRKTIIVLEQKGHYELVVGVVNNDLIKKSFSIETDPMVIELKKLHSNVCKRTQVYPEDYDYTELLTYDEMVSLLPKDPEHAVIGQVITAYKRTSMLLLKNKAIIPIEERVMTDLPFITLEELALKDSIPSVGKLYALYMGISTINIRITGLSVIDGIVNAVKTSYGVHVPVKNRLYSDVIKTIPSIDVLKYKYYFDIDSYMKKDNFENSSMFRYVNSNRILKENIFRIKKDIGTKILEDQRLTVSQIITNPSMNRNQKLENIITILENVISESDKDINFILHVLANEIIDDNVNSDIINGRLGYKEKLKQAFVFDTRIEEIITNSIDYFY